MTDDDSRDRPIRADFASQEAFDRFLTQYDQDRVDNAALHGDHRRVLHEEYAGGAGVAPRALDAQQTARANADRMNVPPAAPTGQISGTIHTSASSLERLSSLSPGQYFRLIGLIIAFGIAVGMAIGLWRGSITFGGTTIERQTVEDQDLFQPQVAPPMTPDGIPPPPY